MKLQNLPSAPSTTRNLGAVHKPGMQRRETNANASHIWRGNIRISGFRNALTTAVVALPYGRENAGDVRTDLVASWPTDLQCDSFKLKVASEVHASLTQCPLYVRFVPVDGAGNEVKEARIGNIAALLMERNLVFEVRCEQNSTTQGTLFLWSTHSSLGKYYLIGGFRPDIAPS